ncbi:hypothetical protein KRP22_012783 [Phytophthora ramorum]|nr:hypothetical protein KRP22_8789 [Phytophthora ramorum]
MAKPTLDEDGGISAAQRVPMDLTGRRAGSSANSSENVFVNNPPRCVNCAVMSWWRPSRKRVQPHGVSELEQDYFAQQYPAPVFHIGAIAFSPSYSQLSRNEISSGIKTYLAIGEEVTEALGKGNTIDVYMVDLAGMTSLAAVRP